MQFYWFIQFLRRTWRAFKVIFLLIRRRDLVRELPGGYLKEMATSNRWVQLQMIGIVAFLVMGFSALIPGGTGVNVLMISFLIGLLTMMAKPLRYLFLGFSNR